jgi:hypothetical protein
MITLNVNGLSLQLRDADWLIRLKNKIQQVVVSKIDTSLARTHTPKVKG